MIVVGSRRKRTPVQLQRTSLTPCRHASRPYKYIFIIDSQPATKQLIMIPSVYLTLRATIVHCSNYRVYMIQFFLLSTNCIKQNKNTTCLFGWLYIKMDNKWNQTTDWKLRCEMFFFFPSQIVSVILCSSYHSDVYSCVHFSEWFVFISVLRL